MPRPHTKDWKALENEHHPSGLHVIVTGLVELEPDQAPVLTERTSRAQVLELALTTRSCKDPDFEGTVWKQAMFHKEVEENQYNSVHVMSGNAVVADFPVLDDSEHATLLAKQTAVQNTVAKGKRSTSTAKKAVKKAVKAVKRVVGKVADAVTGGAKKAAKKTKKVAKKAPKAVGGWAKKRTKKVPKKAPKAKRAGKKAKTGKKRR